MNHAHTHDHTHAHKEAADIRLAFFMNIAFALLEIAGGLWTNSLAILSDALHDLGDSVSLGVSWYLSAYSEKESDERYSYGYRRFSLLGALINTIVLITGSLFILSEAIPRLLKPERSNAQGMLAFAVVGIAVNGVAALRVRGGKTLNAKMVAWHMLEDALGWAAVLLVSLVLLVAEIDVLDPALSLLIAAYVLYNVVRNMKKTLSLFLQGVPDDIEIRDIDARLREIEHVRDTHHTHVWSLDGEHHVLTTHLVVGENISIEEMRRVKEEVRRLSREMEFSHTTVEIECGDGGCSMADSS